MTDKRERPTWSEYFMGIAEAVANRATCDRGRSGCVIVRNNQVLSLGYVGSPAGEPHCDDVGHDLHEITDNGVTSIHCHSTVHAEQNAIANAAKNGVSINHATLYCKMVPCYTCAKMIVNCGIVKVVAAKRYQKDSLSISLFRRRGIILEIIEDVVEEYPKQ